jgi:hypothetical protein
MDENQIAKTRGAKRWGGIALLTGGLLAGGLLVGTPSANAATTTSATVASYSSTSTATKISASVDKKVRAAALAKYPGASIQKVVYAGGIYEVHLTTKAGHHVIVEVNRHYTVIGSKSGR